MVVSTSVVVKWPLRSPLLVPQSSKRAPKAIAGGVIDGAAPTPSKRWPEGEGNSAISVASGAALAGRVLGERGAQSPEDRSPFPSIGDRARPVPPTRSGQTDQRARR